MVAPCGVGVTTSVATLGVKSIWACAAGLGPRTPVASGATGRLIRIRMIRPTRVWVLVSRVCHPRLGPGRAFMILQSIRGRTQEALPLKRPPGGGSGSEFTDANAPFNDETRALWALASKALHRGIRSPQSRPTLHAQVPPLAPMRPSMPCLGPGATALRWPRHSPGAGRRGTPQHQGDRQCLERRRSQSRLPPKP